MFHQELQKTSKLKVLYVTPRVLMEQISFYIIKFNTAK